MWRRSIKGHLNIRLSVCNLPSLSLIQVIWGIDSEKSVLSSFFVKNKSQE